MVFSAVRQWRVPRASQFTVTMARAAGPSQYHALQFVGASGPVSPPFGFLLLLLALFWNLLPFETVKSRKTKSEQALLLPAPFPPRPPDVQATGLFWTLGESLAWTVSLGQRKWEGREGRAKPVALPVKIPDMILWLQLFKL